MPALADVLDALARGHGGGASGGMQLGDLTLRPHQCDAVHRLRAVLGEFGGAILADDPGTGKTFIALALAASAGRASVVAPASLRLMWLDAAARARVTIAFTSLEMLSRGHQPARAPLLVVDEAHRVTNPRARRYHHLAAAAHLAPVLLLSATPVRNRPSELVALLALFLGPAAASADDDLIARCTLRRTIAADSSLIPRAVVHRPTVWRGCRAIAAALRALPPPLPLADGQPAAGLVATGLARCWASSLAALSRAITRRLQRAAALEQALEAGRLPSRNELAAWAVGDDAMQLAFPFLAAPVAGDRPRLLAAVAAHRDALMSLRDLVAPRVSRDTARRAAALRRICAVQGDSTVVAFSVFDATATALFLALGRDPGVVLVTGSGARSGAGPLSRTDVLDALSADAAPTHQRLRVRLVIATDLMSEGVNLQRASTVVHLDEPWTPAAFVQREGRVARIGAPHTTVHFYRFVPGAIVRAIIDMAARHRRKDRAARAAVDGGEANARIGALLERWRRPADGLRRDFVAATAAVAATRNGLLARVERGSGSLLIAGTPRGRAKWRLTTNADEVERVIRSIGVEPRECFADQKLIQPAARAIWSWLRMRRAAALAGAGDRPSATRRRVLARIELLVAAAPPQARPAIAARAAQLRALLAQTGSAGLEVRLAALLDLQADVTRWLDALEEHLSVARRSAAVPAPDELAALLILRRDDTGHTPPTAAASPPPLPSAAPPATGSGTAAPP